MTLRVSHYFSRLGKRLLLRYGGNCLHVLFHREILTCHFNKFVKSGASCGGLRAAILQAFTLEIGKVGLQFTDSSIDVQVLHLMGDTNKPC